MFDFLKIMGFIENPQGYVYESEIDFHESFNSNTGERINFWEGEIKNFRVRVYENGRAFLAGSIHKYFNNGIHNHNKFSICDFIDSIEVLSIKLNIRDLWEFSVLAIEIGVNLELPFSINSILNGIIYHKNQAFSDVRFGKKGRLKKVSHYGYELKFYDKGAQYNLSQEKIRIESKLKADELRRLKINHLFELQVPNIQQILIDWHLAQMEQIIFVNPSLKIDRLSDQEKIAIQKYKTPDYWIDLRNNPRSKNYFQSQVQRNKNIHSKLDDKLYQKIQNMAKMEYTKLIAENIAKNMTPIKYSKEKSGNFRTSIIERHFTFLVKCEVTGLPIFNAKENSRFLNPESIEYYQKNHPRVFREKLLPKLPKKRRVLSERVTYIQIAKAINDEYRDKRRHFEKKVAEKLNQGWLFPPEDMLSKELQKYRELHGLIKKFLLLQKPPYCDFIFNEGYIVDNQKQIIESHVS